MSQGRFTRRYAAYSIDLALLAAPALLLCAVPLRRALDALLALRSATEAGLDRAFAAGHFALFDLAQAMAADPVLLAAFRDGLATILAALALAAALAWGLMLLWFVAFEASPWQATPGKRALGLRVFSQGGEPVGPPRALARFLAAAPSWLLLHLGHAMVGWRTDGRALHDLIAGTRVDGADGPLPGWARAWLAAQGAAVLSVLLVYMALIARNLVGLGL